MHPIDISGMGSGLLGSLLVLGRASPADSTFGNYSFRSVGELLSQLICASQGASSLGAKVSAADGCISLGKFAAALSLSAGLFSLYVLSFLAFRAYFELLWPSNYCSDLFYIF